MFSFRCLKTHIKTFAYYLLLIYKRIEVHWLLFVVCLKAPDTNFMMTAENTSSNDFTLQLRCAA